ncbi:DNA helicase/exodeoxyribonuclease V alpha subunit [Mumia flava]|uniref:RecBCD enzyme subunit RecD n=1 Tax=Mumia flava TaxID=1348852 RepID=A0A2M9B8V8_9ACTN|nr:exodeoxyribonuclease V subunit alpha [Mumia flava]PJJ54394.1 DNA helicase/exodeoxyribonuclease V alpha subunit [Mumia flava]
MTPSTAPTTTGDPALSVTAEGRLKTLNDAGFLDGSDCVVAVRICRQLDEEVTTDAALALAFAIRAVRDGSTSLALESVASLTAGQDDEADLADEADLVDENGGEREAPTVGGTVELPEPGPWLDAVRSSSLVTAGVLRVDLGRVYLDRYHADEVLIADAMRARLTSSVPPVDPAVVDDVMGQDGLDAGGLDEAQAAAVRSVAERATTVLTGGPGMGKTHTISRVLRMLGASTGQPLRIALAAPTGKAAARMNEMIESDPGHASPVSPAVTLHRLLGALPGTTQRFRHDARNPLPHDVVIVDEASMVSLTLMARLIEALAPDSRLLLVGDPDQLASVEAGSVLADLVHGLEAEDVVVRLTKNHRVQGMRGDVAAGLRAGDADAVLNALDSADEDVTFVETEAPSLELLPDVVRHAVRLRELALSGDPDAALDHLDTFRLLCAHRQGPFGTRHWNRLVERALADRVPDVLLQTMYVGRPILVTRNDYALGVRNGDAGVIVRGEDGPLAVIRSGSERLAVSPWRLSDVETMHAMTVHKAQGGQADDVVVIVPPLRSRLLTRETLYTAVTRASAQLTIVGSRDAVRHAAQTPAQRSSGLAERLRNDDLAGWQPGHER